MLPKKSFMRFFATTLRVDTQNDTGQKLRFRHNFAVVYSKILCLLLVLCPLSRPDENRTTLLFRGPQKVPTETFWGEEEPSIKAIQIASSNFKPIGVGSDDAVTLKREHAVFLELG